MLPYTIVPIAGREVIQKNFIALPQKADNYSGRHVSLNERFSVIERGYVLLSTAKKDVQLSNTKTDVQLRKLDVTITREQLKEAILVESEKHRMRKEIFNAKTGLASLEMVDSCDSQPTTP